MRQRSKEIQRQRRFSLVAIFLLLLSLESEAAEVSDLRSMAGTSPPKEETGQGVLTLEEAIRIALENHPGITAAQERAKAQQAVVGQQIAAYYPTITFNNSYRTTNGSDGTSVEPKAFDVFSSQASFDMVLHNFGKREGAVQSARHKLEATRYAYRATANDVVLAVKEAFYGYLQARALLKVREETVKDRELVVRQAQEFFAAGIRARIDVSRAESDLHNARADLIAAESGVKVTWAALKNTLGVEDFPERPMAEVLSATAPSMSLEEARRASFSSRPELQQLDAERKAQDQQLATARRGHLPDILFTANYGRTNSSLNGNTFPLQPIWTVQLGLNIPIFEGFRTAHRVEEALHNYYSVKAQEKQQKQRVVLEVEQSFLRLVEAEARTKATDAAVRSAKENLDLARGRYDLGVGSIIEVTDAQTLHTDAQTNHIRSLYDTKIAEAQLMRAIGRQ